MSEQRNKIIIQFLKQELPKIDKQFKYICSGGCGWFALILFEELKRINIQSEIYLLGWERDSGVDNNKINSCNNLKELSEVYDGWNHVVVKACDHYMDSEGVTEHHEYTACRSKFNAGKLEHGCLVKFLEPSEYNRWNSTFNTDQVPAIKNCIANMVTRLKLRLHAYNFLYIRGLNTDHLMAA